MLLYNSLNSYDILIQYFIIIPSILLTVLNELCWWS